MHRSAASSGSLPSVLTIELSILSSSATFDKPMYLYTVAYSPAWACLFCLISQTLQYHHCPVSYHWGLGYLSSVFHGGSRIFDASALLRVSCNFARALQEPREFADPSGKIRQLSRSPFYTSLAPAESWFLTEAFANSTSIDPVVSEILPFLGAFQVRTVCSRLNAVQWVKSNIRGRSLNPPVYVLSALIFFNLRIYRVGLLDFDFWS